MSLDYRLKLKKTVLKVGYHLDVVVILVRLWVTFRALPAWNMILLRSKERQNYLLLCVLFEPLSNGFKTKCHFGGFVLPAIWNISTSFLPYHFEQKPAMNYSSINCFLFQLLMITYATICIFVLLSSQL